MVRSGPSWPCAHVAAGPLTTHLLPAAGRDQSHATREAAIHGRFAWSACFAAEPRLAQLAALRLGGPAQAARLLVGGQGELQAGGQRLALAADGLGRFDLFDRR